MRPTLVFLHGWGLHGGIWAETAAALAGAGPVAQPDLPGYGGQPAPAPYDAASLAERLAADFAATRPGPLVLVGWSMGGMVALAWAARFPEQVRGLVLVGASPVFRNRADWPHGLTEAALAGFADDLARDHRATLLRFLALQARGGESARAVIARLRGTVFARGEPDRAVLAAGLRLLAGVDLRAEVARVHCPSLVVHGGHDSLCPPAAGRWLAERLGDARLALHPHAAHAPFLSHPDWFHAVVRDFLDERLA